MLPELIGKIITRNANCVTGLQEALSLYDRLFHDFQALQHQYDITCTDKRNIQKVLADISENNDKKEKDYQDRDDGLVSELNSATELAEKQNALIITLEAKVSISYVHTVMSVI